MTYGDEDNGFRVLFDYISGANKDIQEIQMTVPVTQSKEIDMTAPVTQSENNGQMVMRFFCPVIIQSKMRQSQLINEFR